MGLLRIHSRPGKQKRKPGWQKLEAEYNVWLAAVSTMSSGIRLTSITTHKPKSNPTRMLTDTCDGLHPRFAANYIRDVGTKRVARPEMQYAEDPEMLARELAARERKFNVAPAYNKGADQFVSEDELQALLSSNKRRS
jgi:hypothetical protein